MITLVGSKPFGMKIIFTFFAAFCTLFIVRASHIAGAEVTYECVGPGQYLVQLQFYRDCSGVQNPATVTINYSSATCGASGSISLTQVGPPVDISANYDRHSAKGLWLSQSQSHVRRWQRRQIV